MGLGGYLAARTDAEHYATERATEVKETVDLPEKESEEVAVVLRSYGLPEASAKRWMRPASSPKARLWARFSSWGSVPGRASNSTA